MFSKLYKTKDNFKQTVDKAIYEFDMYFGAMDSLKDKITLERHRWETFIKDKDEDKTKQLALQYFNNFLSIQSDVEKVVKTICNYSWRIEPYFNVCNHKKKEYFLNKAALENILDLIKKRIDYEVMKSFKFLKESISDYNE